MGHSDIGVTLNTYTHTKFEDAEEEMCKVIKLDSKGANDRWKKGVL